MTEPMSVQERAQEIDRLLHLAVEAHNSGELQDASRAATIAGALLAEQYRAELAASLGA